MQELDDSNLLREYADHASEEAFSTLVARHINKVYSVALRHTGNPAHAEEITQAVFVILAKKAARLRRGVILSGWLYQTARFAAITFLRSEIRRARREQEAYVQTALNENDPDLWRQIAPLLDAGMAGLNEKDRHAVVLRFFDGKSMSEVGAVLGANENAAKKRVSRALKKLRTFFAKRGVSSTTVLIAGTISTNSVQAAPALLAKSVAGVAIAKSAVASASTLTLAKGALKLMAWTKAKTAIVVGACVLFTAGTATITVKVISKRVDLVQGKTESEWIKSIVYFGDDNQRKLWYSLGPRGVGMLIRALNSPTNDHPTRMCAASILNQFGNYEKEYIPEVVDLLKTEKDDSVLAIELGSFEGTIEKMPEKDKTRLFPELIRALDSRDTSVRNNGLVALQYYPNRANVIVPLVVNALQDPIPGVRVTAVESLIRLDPQNATKSDLVGVLARCVTDPPGNMPGADNNAVLMLGQLHREPDVAIPVLIQSLQSSESYVRANAAASLRRFGSEARPAVSALQNALRDSDPNVRGQAASALRQINSEAPPQ